jgi:hypothetical protein
VDINRLPVTEKGALVAHPKLRFEVRTTQSSSMLVLLGDFGLAILALGGDLGVAPVLVVAGLETLFEDRGITLGGVAGFSRRSLFCLSFWRRATTGREDGPKQGSSEYRS